MDHPDKAQRSPMSLHDGHDPDDPRVVVVEDLAMILCSGCSDGVLRARNPDCLSEWLHHESNEPEASECEASAVLSAAITLGIPIYTGANLEFETINE